MTQERTCKYGCSTTLGEFDTNQNKYKELDGTLHTRERCEALKPKYGKKSNNGSLTNGHNGNNTDLSVEVLLKKLESLGITIDLDKLRNVE